MRVSEIVFLAGGALSSFSFGLVALRIKEAAAHAPLVSDALGMGICCRGSNFFLGVYFSLARFCHSNVQQTARAQDSALSFQGHWYMLSWCQIHLAWLSIFKMVPTFSPIHFFDCMNVVVRNTSDETSHKVDSAFQ